MAMIKNTNLANHEDKVKFLRKCKDYIEISFIWTRDPLEIEII